MTDIADLRARLHEKTRSRLKLLSWLAFVIVFSLPIVLPLVHLVGLLRPRTIVISSGGRGGMYFQLGEDLVPILNETFGGRIRFANVLSPGSVENVRRIESGKAELGFAQDGLDAQSKVRSIARLFNSPLQIVVRTDSKLHSLDDLATAASAETLRIFIGEKGSGTRIISDLILKHYALSESQFKIIGDKWDFSTAAKALELGNLDAAFFLVALDSPALNELASTGNFTLLSIDRAEGIATEFPFLDKITVPPGSYASRLNFPERPVVSVATRELLICSDDLSNRVVYKIAQAMFTRSNEVVTKFSLIAQISQLDPDHNFYYVLHPGALEFYRQRDTPPLVPWPMISFFATYTPTLIGTIWLWVRRKRATKLCDLLEETHRLTSNARHSAELRSRPPAEVHEMADFISEVRIEALQLYKRWKISSDAYDLVRESAMIASGKLQMICASNPKTSRDDLVVSSAGSANDIKRITGRF